MRLLCYYVRLTTHMQSADIYQYRVANNTRETKEGITHILFVWDRGKRLQRYKLPSTFAKFDCSGDNSLILHRIEGAGGVD